MTFQVNHHVLPPPSAAQHGAGEGGVSPAALSMGPSSEHLVCVGPGRDAPKREKQMQEHIQIPSETWALGASRPVWRHQEGVEAREL